MDINGELDQLLTALDAVSDTVEQWDPLLTSLEHGGPADSVGPLPSSGSMGDRYVSSPSETVSGASPAAYEERAIRSAAASLARARARQVRDELGGIRARANLMAEQVRAAAHAHQRRPTRLTSEGVAAALHTASVRLSAAVEPDQATTQIVAGALQVVPRARWGGLCVETTSAARRRAGTGRGDLGGPDQVTVDAASDPLVERLENLQARDGEGPCVQALNGSETVYVPDLCVEQRWPHFVQVASELGVRSGLAVGLSVSRPGGVLSLYSPHPDAFDEEARALVALFADHAAIALVAARRVGALQRAVDTRDVIGQAKGILMHRHAVSADDAFSMLAEASQNSNMKLVEVARWVIANATTL